MAVQTASSTSQQLQIDHEMLLNGPAGTPPAGVISNFDNPPNFDVYLNLTSSLCMVFASLAILTRMYTKILLLRLVRYEDYFAVISWIGLTGTLVVTVMAQRSGLGTHMWDIQLRTFFRLLYLENINDIMYNYNVCLIKTSILLQYQRIFVIQKTWRSPMFVAIQSCIWSIVLFYLAETFFEIFECSPREKIWNKLLTGGHCFKWAEGFEATGIFNSLSDFTLLFIPMPSLWKSQMPLKRKLLTMGIFGVGVLACVASILRVYYTCVMRRDPDTSYGIAITSICSSAELAIGIVVGSLPTMPKFFQHACVKVSKALSFAPKSAIKSGQDPEGISNAPKANALASLKRAFTKYKAGSDVIGSWGDLHCPRAEPHGESLMLTESHAFSLQTTDSLQPRSLDGGTTTKRDDLEYGLHTS